MKIGVRHIAILALKFRKKSASRRIDGRDSVSVNFSSETVDQLAATVRELQDKMPQPQPIDVLMPTVLIQPRKEEGKKKP